MLAISQQTVLPRMLAVINFLFVAHFARLPRMGSGLCECAHFVPASPLHSPWRSPHPLRWGPGSAASPPSWWSSPAASAPRSPPHCRQTRRRRAGPRRWCPSGKTPGAGTGSPVDRGGPEDVRTVTDLPDFMVTSYRRTLGFGRCQGLLRWLNKGVRTMIQGYKVRLCAKNLWKPTVSLMFSLNSQKIWALAHVRF